MKIQSIIAIFCFLNINQNAMASKVVISSSDNGDFRLQKLQENIERLESHIYGSSTINRTQSLSPSKMTVDQLENDPSTDSATQIIQENKGNAQLSSKVDEILADTADLKGKIEELAHKLEQQNEKIKKIPLLEKQLAAAKTQVEGLTEQLTILKASSVVEAKPTEVESETEEDGPSQETGKINADESEEKDISADETGEMAPLPPVKKPAAKKEVIIAKPAKGKNLSADEKLAQDIKKMTAEDAYKKAKSFILEGKNKQAEISLKTFIETFPNDSRIGSAYYFLGELYFVQKKYDLSLTTFAAGYEAGSKDAKAPEYLIKMAQILQLQKKNKEACVIIGQLQKEFPKASDRFKKTAKDLKTGLKCSVPTKKSK